VALHKAASAATRLPVPAQPLDFRVRLEAELRRTTCVVGHAEGEAARLGVELEMRALFAEIADAPGGVLALAVGRGHRPGSSELTPDGFIPGSWGALESTLSGFEMLAERYTEVWKIGLSRMTYSRTVTSRLTVVVRDGRRIFAATATRVSRSVVSVTRVTASRLPHAGAIGRLGGVFGIIGQADNALILFKAFHTNGPHHDAAVGGAAGNWVGGAAGGAVGASYGAAVGLAVGGPAGLLIGAGVGGAIGSFAGSEVGKRTGELIGSKTQSVKKLFGKLH
jgi:hypothetical protein